MNTIGTTQMSSKGQVVIPETIRKQLHLEVGSQFAVFAEEDVVMLKIISPPKLSDLKIMLAKARKAAKEAGITPEDVTAAIKEARKKK